MRTSRSKARGVKARPFTTVFGFLNLTAPTLPSDQPAQITGYLDVAQILSTKFGRNMSQSQTFHLRKIRAYITDSGTEDAYNYVGGAVPVLAEWVAPSRARVSAHEEIMAEYVQDVREDNEWSRGRQLVVHYDAPQPLLAYSSNLRRAGAGMRVNLLGPSGPGAIGMFTEFSARHPKADGIATGTQPDQDLYSEPASQVIEQAILVPVKYHPPIGARGLDAQIVLNEWNGPLTYHVAEWGPPDGTFAGVMCGLIKLTAPYGLVMPRVQAGDKATVPDPRLQLERGNFAITLELDFSGWTPLSRK